MRLEPLPPPLVNRLVWRFVRTVLSTVRANMTFLSRLTLPTCTPLVGSLKKAPTPEDPLMEPALSLHGPLMARLKALELPTVAHLPTKTPVTTPGRVISNLQMLRHTASKLHSQTFVPCDRSKEFPSMERTQTKDKLQAFMLMDPSVGTKMEPSNVGTVSLAGLHLEVRIAAAIMLVIKTSRSPIMEFSQKPRATQRALTGIKNLPKTLVSMPDMMVFAPLLSRPRLPTLAPAFASSVGL